MITVIDGTIYYDNQPVAWFTGDERQLQDFTAFTDGAADDKATLDSMPDIAVLADAAERLVGIAGVLADYDEEEHRPEIDDIKEIAEALSDLGGGMKVKYPTRVMCEEVLKLLQKIAGGADMVIAHADHRSEWAAGIAAAMALDARRGSQMIRGGISERDHKAAEIEERYLPDAYHTINKVYNILAKIPADAVKKYYASENGKAITELSYIRHVLQDKLKLCK